MTHTVIDMADLAVLMSLSVATIQRRLAHEPEPDLPFPAGRIGQRWVIPSAPVRKYLHLDDAAKVAV